MATATPGGPVLTAIPAYQDPSSPLSLAVATLLNKMQVRVFLDFKSRKPFSDFFIAWRTQMRYLCRPLSGLPYPWL